MKKVLMTIGLYILFGTFSVNAFAQTLTDLSYTISTSGSKLEHEYVLIIVNGEQDSLNLEDNGENILYIHQLTADSANLFFEQVVPMPFQQATAFIISDEGEVLKRLRLGDSERIMILPTLLNEIGEEAFKGANTGHVIIPDGCEAIGSRAFSDNIDLMIAEIPASVTQIEDDSFSGASNVTIVSSENSYAIQWAAEHGVTYAETFIEPVNAGDTEGTFSDQ